MPIGNLKPRVMQKTLHVIRATTRSWWCTQVMAQHPAGHGVCLPSTVGRMPSQPCSQERAAPEVQSRGDLGTPWHGRWSPHGTWQWPCCCSHRQLWGEVDNIYGHPGLGRKTCDSIHGNNSMETDWSICLPLQEMGFKRDGCSWIGKIPWRRKWQPTPVFLPGKSHGERSLVGCSPWNHKKSTNNWAWQQQQRSDVTHLRDISESSTSQGHGDIQKSDCTGLGIIAMQALYISASHIHCLSPLITQLPKPPLC